MLVLLCVYFGVKLVVVEGFFKEVGEYVRILGRERGREMGVVVYNFFGVMNGVDMDFGMILWVVRESGNVVGVKLICGSVVKVMRLVVEFGRDRFSVFGG